MKSILITGVSGFVGKQLAIDFINKNYTVIGIDKNKTDIELSDNFRFICAEINEKISKYLNQYSFDTIIHLASQLPSSKSLTYDDFYNGNIKTSIILSRVAKEMKIKQFIYASTCSIFGHIETDEKYLTESSPINPIDYYGLTKYCGEKLLEFELKNSEIDLVIVRFSAIFGRNDTYGLINTFYNLMINNKIVELYSNGERMRNMLYIDDAIDILMSIVINYKQLEHVEYFLAGSKESESVLEIATELKRQLNSHSKIIPLNKYSKYEKNTYLDINKAIEKLNFNPKTIKEGIKKYIR